MALKLLDLPLDILLDIFAHLGSPYFRQRVDAFLVCKTWLDVALAAKLSELKLDYARFPRFLAAPAASHYSAQRHAIDLSLVVRGLEYPLRAPTNTSPEARAALSEWRVTKEAELEKLLLLLPHFEKLLKFSFRVSYDAEPKWMRRFTHLHGQELLPRLLESLPSSLTTLHLDTVGVWMGKLHLCPLLGKLLPKMRVLRLRLQHACPEMLDFDDEEAAVVRDFSVNLSFCDSTGHDIRLYGESSVCPGNAGDEDAQKGCDALAKLITAFIRRRARFPKLKSGWMLGAQYNSGNFVSYNIRTGRKIEASSSTGRR